MVERPVLVKKKWGSKNREAQVIRFVGDPLCPNRNPDFSHLSS